MANPYSGINGSNNPTTGGGSGNWSTTTTTISPHNLPSVDLSGGMCTTYLVDEAKLKSIKKFLWGWWNGVARLVYNAQNAVIDLYALPITPSLVTGVDSILMIGDAAIYDGLVMQHGIVPVQSLLLDFGTVTIDKYTDSFLDYNNYTQIDLYLPYVGTVNLDANVVMGTTINVKYAVDLRSGVCVALVYSNSSLIGQYSGNCSYKMPIIERDNGRTQLELIEKIANLIIAGASI